MILGPAQCRGQLADLLDRQLADAQAFRQVLEQERDALGLGDIAAIDRASQRKLELSERLDALRQEMTGFVAGIFSDIAPDSLRQAIHWADDASGKLVQRSERLETLLAECQQLNQSNGVIVEKRKAQVRRALEVLKGGMQTARLYGRHGDAVTGGDPGRSLAKA